MTMTSEERQAIKDRCEKASKGPWEHDEFGCEAASFATVYADRRGRIAQAAGDDAQTVFDATFIAHARSDIPKLLAEVERLEKELGKCGHCGGTGSVGEYRRESSNPEKNFVPQIPCPICKGSGTNP